MKPAILLTGKTGQLGSELHRLLPRLGEVIALDRKELDLSEPEKIRQIMRNVKPQLVVNAAAYTAVDAAETDECNALSVNAEAPHLLALEAKKIGAMLVHFSTDYVFDGSKKAPYVETDPTNPLNAYGRTKLAGEQAIRDSGAAHLILRPSWLYSTHGRNFLLTILRLSTEREELRIVDDQVGAPTCVSDLAEATAKILASIIGGNRRKSFPEASGTHHVTAGGRTTWFGFAKAIIDDAQHSPQNLPWFASATNSRPVIASRILPIATAEFRSATPRPAYSVLSNARLDRK